MSATNRGAKRQEADFYATPKEAFDPLLPHIRDLNCGVWEPACGDRRLINWMKQFGIEANGDDIRATLPYDFLVDTTRRDCNCTNPPFSLALEFCNHSIKHAQHTFMLLRLNFMASGRRREWWRANEPKSIFVLSDRPNFVMACRCMSDDCGHRWTLPIEADRPKLCPQCQCHVVNVSTSDSCAYAWYYWGPHNFKPFNHL